MRRPPLLLHGIPIENVTLCEAIELIGRFVVAGRAGASSHQVATVNLDFLANAVEDSSIADILRTAELCLADGMPLVWAGKLLNMPIVERVAGADLVPSLIDASQSTGWHIHVFGSSRNVADRARRIVEARYPLAHVTFDPGPAVDAEGDVASDVLDRLTEMDPDIICVALGNPKQERFIERHRTRIGAPVMIGVGGSLDLMVGARKRAPRWIQRFGLEWVVRAAQEPRRLGVRYARDIKKMGPWLVRQWRGNRARKDRPGLDIDIRVDEVVVRLGTAVTATEQAWSAAAGRIAAGAALRIEPDRCAAIDDRAAAWLVGLIRESRRARGQVVWSHEPADLAESLATIGITPDAAAMTSGVEWSCERS